MLHREVYHRGKGSHMQERKSKAKLQIVFSGLILALVFIVELYAMINLPEQFIVIGALGVVLLICLYVLIQAVMKAQAEKESRREEQYDSIFKSEKASYLMLKKYFEEIEDKLEVIEKLSKLPTEEITGTQKGIGKVIINRTRENAEAIINSNELVLDEMKEIKSAIDSKNEALLGSCKSMNDDTVQQILLKQQDLLLELKNMELHLSNAIMQNQKTAAPAAVYAAPIMQQVPAPAPASEPTPVMPEPEPVFEEPEPIIEEPEPIFEETAPIVEEPEPIIEEPASIAEPEIQPAIDEPIMTAEPQPQPVIEEPTPIVEPEPQPAAAAPELDLSDPNKQLSADEIAALFASMSDNGTDSTPEPAAEEPQPVIEEPTPVAEPEPQPAAAAPELDLSDPNKQLSPDEIAALFASMTDDATNSTPEPAAAEPAPAAETPKTPDVDLSDPNRQLSPDEIAALFSSMSS